MKPLVLKKIKKISPVAAGLIFFCLCVPAMLRAQSYNIIPRPVQLDILAGKTFTFDSKTVMLVNTREDFRVAAAYFQNLLWEKRQVKLPIVEGPANGNKVIRLLQSDKITNPEGYHLRIEPDEILMEASTGKGIFYAIQSLRQMFGSGFETPAIEPHMDLHLMPVDITDAPRFSYRGLHLDVCRHFFPVEFVKRYIDLMAMHKFNTLHWHLTEDQGWRIEIKKYPELTAIGSKREETLIGHAGTTPKKFDGTPYGGFYTQEQIKEIIKYASDRFITIIPEIEMPGHALAALSAYPQFSCTGGPFKAATEWGVFDDVYCAGKEETFTFIENILDEVSALFPGTYVHIGGDECPKTRWKTCAKCQQRMKNENLKDEHELQSYFIRRVEKMLQARGKKLIGWDEILEGGLAPDATVMSWRGTEGGIAAAREHHDVIMTPGSHCYFDHYQSKSEKEPQAIGGFTSVEKVYGFEPIPSELNAEEARHILGAQANLWTEYIPTPEHAEYMLWPRACALAEVVWTPAGSRNWTDFLRRFKEHAKRLDGLKVNYAKHLLENE